MRRCRHAQRRRCSVYCVMCDVEVLVELLFGQLADRSRRRAGPRRLPWNRTPHVDPAFVPSTRVTHGTSFFTTSFRTFCLSIPSHLLPHSHSSYFFALARSFCSSSFSIVAAASSGTQIALHDAPRIAGLENISVAALDQCGQYRNQTDSALINCHLMQDFGEATLTIARFVRHSAFWRRSSESHAADSHSDHLSLQFPFLSLVKSINKLDLASCLGAQPQRFAQARAQ